MRKRDSSWSVRLLGEFELRNSQGEPIEIRRRNVRGLLAMLIVGGDGGVSRSLLRENLWPEQDLYNQQNSLRQAIAQLKRIIGADSLLATRDRCRLSEEFAFICDATAERDASMLREFMTEFETPWFQGVRSSQAYVRTYGSPHLAAPVKGPVDGFIQLLQWYADRSPARALELLRDNLDLATGVGAANLKIVIDRATPMLSENDSLYGWLAFWNAAFYLNTDVELSGVWFRQATDFARDHSDMRLESEAVYHLGLVKIISGRPDIAENEFRRAMALSSQRGGHSLSGRATDLGAHVQLHRGDTKGGLRQLEYAGELYGDNAIRVVHSVALRALYCAVEGSVDEANRLVESAAAIYPADDHFGLNLALLLTRGLIAAKVNEVDTAMELLREVLNLSMATSTSHFEIYAREALAGVSWKMGEKSESKKQIAMSNQIRRKLKMNVTKWDRQRLAEVPIQAL